jgi:hypothetical protein
MSETPRSFNGTLRKGRVQHHPAFATRLSFRGHAITPGHLTFELAQAIAATGSVMSSSPAVQPKRFEWPTARPALRLGTSEHHDQGDCCTERRQSTIRPTTTAATVPGDCQ